MVVRETLHAVYDHELEQLLDSLGLRSKFHAGRLLCAFSRDVITWENLNAVFPDSGEVKVVCTKPECVAALAEKLEGQAQ